jgi:hypothetical protein
MVAHRRVLIQPVRFAVYARMSEMVAKYRVPAQLGRSHQEGHERRSEDLLPQVGRAADATYLHGRIEGGADLVVEERRTQILELGAPSRQGLLHIFRRHRPAVARKPDRAHVRKAGKHLSGRGLQEEYRPDPRLGE